MTRGPQSLQLEDAVRYAVDLLEPLARDARVTLSLEIAPDVSQAQAGPAFTIVVNGLRNAIESVSERARTRPEAPRRVDVCVKHSPGEPQRIVIEITDTGIGPPQTPPLHRPAAAGTGRLPGPFDIGFTTKATGSGVGLALCREMIEDVKGEITLSARDDGPGAILRAVFPMRAPLHEPAEDEC